MVGGTGDRGGVLEAVMEHTRAQLAYLDGQFRFIRVNAAYASGSGRSREELVGRNHFDLFPDAENQAIFERARDTGQGVEFLAKPFVFADQPDRRTTYWDWTLTPIGKGEGPAEGLVLSLVDVTERVRAVHLRDALTEINTSINSTQDFGLIVSRVLARASQALGCDNASLTLREGELWRLSAAFGLPDETIGMLFTDAEAPYAARAAAARDVCLVEDVANDPTIPAELAATFGVRSFMVVPLIVHGACSGTLFFNYTRLVSFGEAQIDFARKLSTSVSLALENARLVKELEQRVQARTAQLQAIFDSLPDAIYVGDENGITRCNQRALDILGCSSLKDLRDKIPNLAEKIRTRYADTGVRIPPEQEPFVRALAGERVVVEMFQRNLQTGEDIIVRSACAPVVQQGQVIGAVAVNTDITERRNMVEALRRTQAMYQTLQDALPSMVWSSDPAFRPDYVNSTWQAYTGLDLEGLRESGWRSVYHPDDDPGLTERWREATRAAQPFDTEFRLRRHDGAYRWMWSRTVPLLDEAGQVVKWIGAIHDIEDRRRAEEVLRAHDSELHAFSRRMVEALEAERRSIARELHDESGQSLTYLKVALSLLRRDPECPDSFTSRLDELRETTDDVLDSLRRLAMDLRPGALDKAGLATAVKQYVEAYQIQTGIDVDFVALGLENGRLAAEVETNLYRMIQEALTNIARHSRATEAGILLERSRGRVLLMIEDNGVGFDLPGVAQTGHLGLIGMRERAEMIGGKLHVETAAGCGTALYVDIPYDDPHRA